jgi:dGTPase
MVVSEGINNEKHLWKSKVKAKILSGYAKTQSKSPSVLAGFCEGASPAEVKSILSEITDDEFTRATSWSDLRLQTKFFFKLPAANPEYFQWWYTLDSQEKIASTISEYIDLLNSSGLCIGTPTVAAFLRSINAPATLLDVDGDIIDTYKTIFNTSNASRTYDVYDELPEEFSTSFDYIVLDPPWYQNHFEAFFNKAILAVKEGGIIFCSIPKILTRPNIEEQRVNIIQQITKAGHELLFIEKGVLKYIVPKFEEVALSHENRDFEIKPWRSSDLIAFRIWNNNQIELSKDSEVEFSKSTTKVFSREKSQALFRIFINDKNNISSLLEPIIKVPEYSKSISKREPCGVFNVWNSNKQAFKAADLTLVQLILESWSAGETKENVILKISSLDKYNENSAEAFQYIENALKLWEEHSEGSARRSDDDIKKSTISINNEKYAASPTEKSRQHPSSSDGFRTEYQRDRDRIIWSSGFRKLSDKTQLFPLSEDDHLRQRLAHSIEVSQLASTIAASFGLDKELVEAGALAHDIGHTPFGHAGEFALDGLLKNHLKIKCGFNHYEHGVDVVRYLEGAYQNVGLSSHSGLNLTNEVCECILKHTYCHTGHKEDKGTIYGNSKHQDIIKEGFSHLEGQAVRAADKISYLLSDIEDGIKLNAVSYNDLISCRLFHRTPIDFRLKNGESLYFKFLEQRGSIIKLLMEDLILESSKRLTKINNTTTIFNVGQYTIFQSATIDSDMDEIWKKIQVAKLHKDPRVMTANLNAARKVSELALLYVAFPSLIEEQFRLEHGRLKILSKKYIGHYDQFGSGDPDKAKYVEVSTDLFRFLPMDRIIGEELIIDATQSTQKLPVYDIVLSKDYVASLTDKKVNSLYEQLIRG